MWREGSGQFGDGWARRWKGGGEEEEQAPCRTRVKRRGQGSREKGRGREKAEKGGVGSGLATRSGAATGRGECAVVHEWRRGQGKSSRVEDRRGRKAASGLNA
eukprot:scaffold87776_cov32-Tisochrysis_lutea.AAC.1